MPSNNLHTIIALSAVSLLSFSALTMNTAAPAAIADSDHGSAFGKVKTDTSLAVPGSQTFSVSDTVITPSVERDAYTFTNPDGTPSVNAKTAEAQAKAKQLSADLQKQIAQMTTDGQRQMGAANVASHKLNTSTETSLKKAEYVQEALKHVGVPYVFGGANPTSGWDCSGFVLWVFQKENGITMPHYVPSIEDGYTKPVKPSEAQPGDLVVFSNSSEGRHHIGIYLGNGLLLHAPKPGSQTQITPIWWYDNVNFITMFDDNDDPIKNNGAIEGNASETNAYTIAPSTSDSGNNGVKGKGTVIPVPSTPAPTSAPSSSDSGGSKGSTSSGSSKPSTGSTPKPTQSATPKPTTSPTPTPTPKPTQSATPTPTPTPTPTQAPTTPSPTPSSSATSEPLLGLNLDLELGE